MKEKIKVSVIIPTKNRSREILKVLKSLKKQTYKNIEVIIVEGGEIIKTRKSINKIKGIKKKLILQKTKGLVNAVNEGFKKSTGDIIIRTDDDIVASREWIYEIVKVFKTSDKIGGVTGPTIIPKRILKERDLFLYQSKLKKGNIFWKIIGKLYFNYFMEKKAYEVGLFFKSGAFSVGSNFEECLKFKKMVEVDHHEACNMAIRRNVLYRIGCFDASYKDVGEYHEAAASFNIRALGYKIIFNPKAVIYHLPSQSGVFLERVSTYSRMENFIKFYLKHIKMDSFSKSIRFCTYLLFINSYYLYKFIITGKIGYIESIPSTIVSFISYLFKLKR